MRNDLPRLGKIEHGPIEAGLVDSVIGTSQLHVVAVEHLLTQDRADVLLGSLGEVLAKLVAGDVGPGSKHGHRQCAGPNAGLEYSSTGEDVGDHQNRAKVLWIDHLGTARHLEDQLRQRRADHQIAGLAVVLADLALGLADHRIVRDGSLVGMELLARLECHHVTAVLGVDEVHDLPCGEWLVAHVRSFTGAFPNSTGWEVSTATRSTRRQNAHTSPVVGLPQRSHGTSETSSLSPVNSVAARSRNPK